MTTRLVLREFTDHDLASFSAYRQDLRYAEFYGPGEADPDVTLRLLHDFQRWARERPRRNFQVAIADRRGPGDVLGSAGLRREGLPAGQAEFGIELAAPVWGRGYAFEAAGALLAFGFAELGLSVVRAVSVTANERIQRLLRRLGFAPAGVVTGPRWMTDRGWAQAEWRLSREAWHAPSPW